MIIPDIYKFKTLPDFMLAFINENKTLNPHFSYSYFAKRIKWPRSLLGDVATGRKPLPISRALAFTQFFNLDLLKTERFILLSLAFKEPELNALIERWSNSGSHQYPTKTSNNVEVELTRSVHLTVVYDYLRLVGGRPTAAEVVQNLTGIHELTVESVEQCYTWLKQKGYLEKENISSEPLNVQEVGMKTGSTHSHYAMNLVRYCEARSSGALKSRSFVCAQFIKLPQSAHAEFRARMIELAQWAGAFEKSLSHDDLKKSSLHQFDLNLFPVQEAEI